MQNENRFESCPVLLEMLATHRAIGKSGRLFEDLGALSTPNNLAILRALMAYLRPAKTLEIGLSFGGSALVFTSSHRDHGAPPAAQHLALDPFQETVWDSCGLMAVERAGLSGYLNFRAAFSAVELPKLFEQGQRYDLVYVDGSHLFEDVFVDAYFAGRLLNQGGVVAFDDCQKPHVAKVIRFLRRSLAGALEEMDLSPFRADAGKSLKYRIARMAGRTQMTAFRRIGDPERAWDAPFVDF